MFLDTTDIRYPDADKSSEQQLERWLRWVCRNDVAGPRTLAECVGKGKSVVLAGLVRIGVLA